jgi:hypothetical protein
MSTNHKLVTLKAIEADKESSSLWVVNKTNPRGVLNVSMPDGLGGTVVMVIPITWIPIDLTTQATKENLLKSPVFRRLVTNGSIGLIDEEQAEDIMSDSEAQKEAKRVYSAVTAGDELNEGSAKNPDIEKLNEEDSGNVSGFAMNIVGMELEEDAILTMVRGQDGALNKDDYTYIAANSPMVRVKEYCAQRALDLA